MPSKWSLVHKYFPPVWADIIEDLCVKWATPPPPILQTYSAVGLHGDARDVEDLNPYLLPHLTELVSVLRHQTVLAHEVSSSPTTVDASNNTTTSSSSSTKQTMLVCTLVPAFSIVPVRVQAILLAWCLNHHEQIDSIILTQFLTECAGDSGKANSPNG